MDTIHSVLGFAALCALAWLLGGLRRPFPWRLALGAAAMQIGMAAALLHLPFVKAAFGFLNKAVLALETATRAGTGLVFGFLGGGTLPFAETAPGASFVLAFQALPLVLVISALSALLFHWGILPFIVRLFAALLKRSLGIGGPVGFSAAANIFVGMVEAPLFIRPYLVRLSRADLFAVMTCGMAGIAGTVMVLYATFLSAAAPDALGHILVASVVTAPAGILIARLMVPEDASAPVLAAEDDLKTNEAESAMEALVRGISEGVQLLIAIIAMLIVFVALVYLANQIVGLLPDVGGKPLSLQRMLGWVMTPVVWLMGLTWAEAQVVGQLMGVKTILNELIAYLDLAHLPADALSPRARLMAVYALCGFANFGSLGIMLGGLSAMVPERRADVVALGPRTIVSGTLSTVMAGAVVGMLL